MDDFIIDSLRSTGHMSAEVRRQIIAEIECLLAGWERLREVDPEWVREAEEELNG